MGDHVRLPRAWGQLKWSMLHGIPGEEATGKTGWFSVCSFKILLWLQNNRIPSALVCDVMQPRYCVVSSRCYVHYTGESLGSAQQKIFAMILLLKLCQNDLLIAPHNA